MNSALKPVLTSSGPQNPPVTTQLNKPMHPQGTPSTYGQPSTHLPQGLVNLPHNNPNVAHSHPNPAHQTNHYSLNVPNAPQHYTSNNPSTIPASNHPVPISQASTGGQTYSPNKNAPFPGGYQPNLGHPPNQNPIPPVSQNLPATQPTHHTPTPGESLTEKPQSNGTAEVKSPAKPEPQENHISSLPKDKSPVPPSSPKICEKTEEKNTSAVVVEQKQQKQENAKVSEETKASLPASESTTPTVNTSPNLPTNKPSTDNIESTTEVTNISETKTETSSTAKVENSEPDVRESPPDPGDNTNPDTTQNVSPPKSKEKEQKNPPVAKTTTPRTPTRKSKTPKLEGDSPKTSKVDTKPPSAQKSPNIIAKSKRTRTKTQPYQSPLPEIEIITKISSSTPKNKTSDDKLIVFYKNEFLAVRNSEGSFYICQAVQNIYKSSPKIRIRWLSQEKSEKSGEVYTPDFYDNTDFDCILTNLNLVRVDKGRYRLPPAEKERTDSILKRSLAVEKGEVTSPSLTEEHPDGKESQLKKRKGTKRKASSSLKVGRKPSDTTKSPEQPKVRKVAVKTRKVAAKKPAAAPRSRKTTAPPVETKKPTTSSTRTDRAKRRSDNQNHNKVSPVVDQKKARVLAKVARKTAVNTNKSQSAIKNAKVAKATPSSSKVQKPPPKAATRKTKRSSRK